MRISRLAALSRGRAVKFGAVALLVGSALLTNLAKLTELWSVHPAANDEMARRDQRFEPLRNALPKRGTVGYISDAGNEAERERRLLLAQFALVPVILVSGTEQALVVGDFSVPEATKQGLDLKLTVLRDFGDGVVLFARPER